MRPAATCVHAHPMAGVQHGTNTPLALRRAKASGDEPAVAAAAKQAALAAARAAAKKLAAEKLQALCDEAEGVLARLEQVRKGEERWEEGGRQAVMRGRASACTEQQARRDLGFVGKQSRYSFLHCPPPPPWPAGPRHQPQQGPAH